MSWNPRGTREIHAGFSVRSAGRPICSQCSSDLKCIGSRHRFCIFEDGENIYLVIRRLRCKDPACGKIHHELPDMLVPYKRHVSASLEQVIEAQVQPDKGNDHCCAETSTLRLWNEWCVTLATYWYGCLQALATRMGQIAEKEQKASFASSLHALHALQSIVGKGSGWLARIVRPVVNANLWVHTRSKYVTVPP